MGELEKKFIVPPFSILDTKQKYWQDRKKKWIQLGIKSEVGRGDNLTFGDCAEKQTKYGKCNTKAVGGNITDEEYMKKYGKPRKEMNVTSIFDPVLCELCYKWFTPKEGKILDPFAGGSVRGVIAYKEGYNYLGLELSATQVAANKQQAIDMDVNPTWLQGDSDKLLDEVANESCDLIFTCPPYADLEVYSDHPDDLSNKSYDVFLQKHESIIKKCITKLKDNRFAVFVVGDVRDKKGMYRCFVEDTVKCFTNNGMFKYNEIILVNAIGSLPIRVSAQFKSKRKVGKMHQNVLVFFKGSPDKIVEDFNVLNLFVDKQSALEKWGL